MKTKCTKNLGFFLGISFFVFNNFPSLGECTLGRQRDAIACSCLIGSGGASTTTVYTPLHGETPEAACQKCMPGEFNLTRCQPWKK